MKVFEIPNLLVASLLLAHGFVPLSLSPLHLFFFFYWLLKRFMLQRADHVHVCVISLLLLPAQPDTFDR
eukprot:m.49321 g.49321  ORF g.49321 m.49321 type:complete len:69 (+) comp12468_c1_seq1:63-269(+)